MSSSHNCASLLSYVCPLETWRCQLPRFPPWITRWEHCLSEAFAPPCTIFPPMQLVQRSWPFYSQAVWYHDYAINKLLPTSVIKGPLHLADCGKYTCFPIITSPLCWTITQIGILWYNIWRSPPTTPMIHDHAGYLTRSSSLSSLKAFTVIWSRIMQTQKHFSGLLG